PDVSFHRARSRRGRTRERPCARDASRKNRRVRTGGANLRSAAARLHAQAARGCADVRMTPLIRKLLGMNWVLIAAMLALSVFGVIAVYSATFFRTDEYWHKQAVWVGIGLAVFLITSLTPYRFVKWAALPLYLLGIGLVVLTYTGMGREIGGAKC